MPLTQCPVSQFSFFSFNFQSDEKNNEGEEQEVRDDNHPKGREEHYEEEDDEEEDGAAAAEKSRQRAEMQPCPISQAELSCRILFKLLKNKSAY